MAIAQKVLWVNRSHETIDYNGPIQIEMAVDANENAYVLYALEGKTTIDDVVIEAVGIRDILLVKYDSDGHMVWSRQVGGPSGSIPVDITIGPTDDVFITGSLYDNCDFLGEPFIKSLSKSFVARINPSGSLVWMSQITSPADGLPIAVSINKNNVAMVSGYIDATHHFLTTWNAAGALLWLEPLQIGTCCDTAYFGDIAADDDGNFVIVGSFIYSVTFPAPVGTLYARHLWSAYVAKVTPAGEFLWAQKLDTDATLNEARPKKVRVDGSGNIYVLGFFENELIAGDIKIRKKHTNDDRNGFLIKLNSSGVFLWGKGIFAYDIIPDDFEISEQTNEIFFIGYASLFFNYNDEYTIPPMSSQTVLVTTDMNGEFKHALRIGENSNTTYQHALSVTQDHELLVAGNYSRDVTFGCVVLDEGRYNTAFLIKLGDRPEVSINKLNSVCENTTIRIHVSGAELATKFVWRFSGGITPAGGHETTEPYIDVVVEDVDEAFAYVTPYFNCQLENEYSTSFTISQKPSLPAKPLGEVLLCHEAALIYQVIPVNNADNYYWTVSDNLQVVTDGSKDALIKATATSGTATIQVKASNECGETGLSDPLQVGLKSIPQPPVIHGVDSICTFSNAEFTVTSPDAEKYRWRFSSGMTLKTSNADSSLVRFTSNVIGQHTINVASVGYCGASTSETFVTRVLTGPNPIDVVGNDIVCADQESVIYNVTPQQEGKIKWTFPGGFIKTDETDFSVTFSTSDQVSGGSITASLENVCASVMSSKLVQVSHRPPKPFIRINDCNTILTYAGNDPITWYKDSFTLGETGKEFVVRDSASYHVEMHHACGSIISNAIVADPIYPSTVFIPNVVTGRVEGKNDEFIIDEGLKGSSLSIFDRWGNRVYESSNYRNTWSGEDLAGGTYFYVLRSHCLDQPLKGVIYLMK